MGQFDATIRCNKDLDLGQFEITEWDQESKG